MPPPDPFPSTTSEMITIYNGVRVNGRLFRVTDPQDPSTLQDAHDLEQILTEKQAKRLRAAGSIGDGTRTVPMEPKGKEEGVPLPEDFPALEELVGAKLTTYADVQNASDEELLAIDGIGEGTLKKIRKAS